MPSLAHPPNDVVRPVGGPHDLRGDEDDVEEVAEEEEAQRRELTVGGTPIQHTFKFGNKKDSFTNILLLKILGIQGFLLILTV